MPRSAKRSRNAAGKSLGDMCAAQKALATDGSSVRGGQLHGRRAADTLLLGIGRSPRLLEDSAPARSGAERALSFRRADRLRADVSHASLAKGGHGPRFIPLLLRLYVVRTCPLRPQVLLVFVLKTFATQTTRTYNLKTSQNIMLRAAVTASLSADLLAVVAVPATQASTRTHAMGPANGLPR